MKLDVGENGVTIDAVDLAPLLRLEPGYVQAAMRRGDISSLYEKGVAEDEGRFRVTFRHGTIRLRLTCTGDGTVISRSRTEGAQR